MPKPKQGELATDYFKRHLATIQSAGGKARAKDLTLEQRRSIARMGGLAASSRRKKGVSPSENHVS